MFYDNAEFPWISIFENGWKDIRDELLALDEAAFRSWPEIRYYNKGWSTFGFYGWGVRFDKHCEKCPKTAALIDQVPRIFNAGFSMMKPKTHIRPHEGFKEGVLRLHVPLIVPGECIFRVADEKREWKEGECFVFDDTVNHEAWNNSDETRIVLLVDFKAEDLVVNPPEVKDTWLTRLLG